MRTFNISKLTLGILHLVKKMSEDADIYRLGDKGEIV